MDLDRTALVFVYGTLKRGFPNHFLLADLIRASDASFIAAGRTARRFPLVVGPLSIPFLLHFPGYGKRVSGELYAVSPRGLACLDEFEGTARCHYDRLPVVVVPFGHGVDEPGSDDNDAGDGADSAAAEALQAEAYFAHRSFAGDMWQWSGEKGLGSYSEEDARAYIRPMDRPPGTTFLGEVRRFLGSPN